MDDVCPALALYLGRPASAYQRAQPSKVRNAYGDDMAKRIIELMEELGALAPDWQTHTLQSATLWAEAEMRRRHPSLNDAAIDDLGWAFSYSWR